MLIMKEMRHACTIRPARKRDLEDFLELEEAILVILQASGRAIMKAISVTSRMKEGEKIFLLGILGHRIVGFVIIHLSRKLDSRK